MHDDIVADRNIINECQRYLPADAGDIDQRLITGTQFDNPAGECETHRGRP
jgi:hypothetical protein